MSNKVVFEVYVDDNGTLKAATKGVRDLGAEVSKTASAHKNASSAADGHFNRQEKGVIGTSNSTRNFAKLRQTIDGGSNSLVGAYATLAANVFAVSATFLALKDAAQLQQVEAGIRSMGNQMGVTLELTSKKVQELSGGLLTAQQAARSTAQVMSAGFATKDLERITVVARQASLTLGRDMTDSMDRLTRGIIKLEPELIDELGIMTRLDEATSLYAVQLGKTASSLTAAEKRQGFMNAALAEGELKFGSITGDDKLNNLAKLGTEFQNLTKDILNLVNVLAIPLAGILGSKGLLLSGMVLFASTISSQLLPGLANAATKSTKVAQELSAAAKESALAAKPTGGRQSAGFTELKKSIKDGSATLEDFRIRYDVTTAGIAANEKKLADSSSTLSQKKIAALEKANMVRRQELIILRELTIAEAQAAAARSASVAINAASSDITGLSSGKTALMTSIRAIAESTHAYNASLTAASATTGTLTGTTGTLSRGLIIARTGMYGAALGAKVLGSALLNMLPVIGQIILALTLLFEGGKMLFTAIVGKEVLEANKQLKTITDEINNKAKERQKISAATVSASIKEQKTSELLSNSIKEVTESYEAANAARKAQIQKGMGGGTNGRLGNRAEVVATTDKSAMKQLIELKALDPVVERAINSSIELAGGMDKVRKSASLQARVLREVNAAFTGYGAATNSAAEALKELNTAAGALTKSSIPTTQYDGFAMALTNTNAALAQMSVESAKSGRGIEGMASIISGLGPDIQKFLSPETRKAVADYNTQVAVVTKLTNLGAKRTAAEEQTLVATKAQVVVSANKLQLASLEIVALEDRVTLRQVESIALGSIIALEQARLNKMNKTAAVTGEEVKQRIDAENRVLRIQAAQILASTWALKLELESIKLIREKDEEYKKFIKTIKEGTLESELGNTATRITMVNQKISDEKSAMMKALYMEELKVLQAKEATIRREKSLQNREKVAQAGISAAQNQAAAVLLGITSEGVSLAEQAAQEAERKLNILNDELQVEESLVKLMQAQYSMSQKLGVINDSEYLSAIAFYNKLLPLLKEKTDLEEISSLAKIDEIIAEKKSSGAPNSAIEELERQKDTIESMSDLKKAQLESEAKTSILNALGIMDGRAILELQKEGLEVLKEQVVAREAAIVAAAALLKEQKELAINKQGREVSPAEERALAIELAETTLNAALEVQQAKKDSIALEYQLLDAKYKYDKAEALQKAENLRVELTKGIYDDKERTAMQASQKAYENYASTVEKIIGTIPGMTAAAIKEVDNANQGLLNNLERAKIPAARLSGPDTSFGNANANLEKDATLSQRLTAANTDLEPMFDKLKSLGPQGEFVSAISQGSLIMADAILKVGEAGLTSADGLAAMGAIVGQVAAIAKAGADAKISAIESEISAEQKRDGKSAESVAKIASLEKKKDAAAKKSFEINKKLMMAQTVINTSSAVVGMLASTPGPVGFALAAAAGALGIAQLAIIAGTSYQSSGSGAASAAAAPASLSIGTRSNSVDLAKNNSNAGGESGYVTGARGSGTDSSNFRRAAYGGRAGIIVGEKGPETIYPDVSATIASNDDSAKQAPGGVNASFTIQAMDSEGVEKVLLRNRGQIISMLREAANSNGQTFLENVNTARYKQAGSRL